MTFSKCEIGFIITESWKTKTKPGSYCGTIQMLYHHATFIISAKGQMEQKLHRIPEIKPRLDGKHI